MNRIIFFQRGLLASLALLLGACNSDGTVNLGSGQAPDPGTADFPIAYVKRTIPMQNGELREGDLRQLRDAAPDADLWVRDRAAPSAPERNVTERITGDTDRYDIRDVNVSWDGKKFIFAMRGPLAENQDEKKPPFWTLWEYDIATDDLRRVIDSDIDASTAHDVAPAYLPDGRIVFSSTRQRQSRAVLLDEGKPGFEAQTQGGNESAFLLHVMENGGGNVQQISFNQSHDLTPTILQNGRLMWSRWDGATGRGIHLYTANPDGTNVQLLYGARSHQTGTDNSLVQFTQAREMQDGQILALLRPYTDSQFGGDLVMIDAANFVENVQPLAANAGMLGPAQTRATPNRVSTLNAPSPGGRFLSGFPLWDGTRRILVSWSQCRLMDRTVTPAAIVACTDDRMADPAAEQAPPLYGAFMFDPADGTLRPIFTPVEGVMITDVVAAQPRPLPAVLLDRVPGVDFDPQMAADSVGILDIRSVYDFDGLIAGTGAGNPALSAVANPSLTPASQRPARFLRIEKAVSLGDDDLDQGFPNLNNAAFGASGNFMREILGYAPIEPDGSVRVRVPANVAFVISVLDANGRRLFPLHRNWLQLRAGETRACNGCHQQANPDVVSHGRDGTFVSASPGSLGDGFFPGAAPTIPALNGETMAQAHARWSCVNESCASEMLSVNLVDNDIWTDPASAQPVSYDYSDLTTPPPTAQNCLAQWSGVCRIIINYREHIHPLWSVDRGENTCTNCHSSRDSAGLTQLPAQQLDLSDGDSNDQPLHLNAYRELLYQDNEQELIGGVLQDKTLTTTTTRTVTNPDTGEPETITETLTQTIPWAPPLLSGNARGSARFFNTFSSVGSHAGRLTPAELRLISEWVDIGAQYFNNPFDPDAPTN
ncbi:MAG: hypothetical protein LBE59_03965 [Nevskiaceae bacterium]|nr:hypothetical protein [Nevskiaceae bacterium]